MSHALSAHGLALIQEMEGFQAEPRQLPTGGWVVGYSHVRAAEPGDAINENEAAEMLVVDLASYEAAVNNMVTTPLTQTQFDALVSFAFSVGSEAFGRSQVLRRVNAGDFLSAACAMDAWRKSDVGGELVVLDALVRRRAVEKALFLRELPQLSAPSVFVRAQLDHAASILGAPVAHAPIPEVGSIAPAAVKPAAGERLTQILRSEPATEALLLTQVVSDQFDEDGEITTAHAKPVARYDFEPRIAPRRVQTEASKPRFIHLPKIAAAQSTEERTSAKVKALDLRALSFEGLGLAALMLFGLGLIATSVSVLVAGEKDMAQYAVAAAFGAPGIAAVSLAALFLWRTPQPKPAPADVEV